MVYSSLARDNHNLDLLITQAYLGHNSIKRSVSKHDINSMMAAMVNLRGTLFNHLQPLIIFAHFIHSVLQSRGDTAFLSE